MRKTITASLACALCYGAAFGFDLMGFVKDTIGIESGITAGFSRDDRRKVVKDDIYKLMWQDGEDIYQGTYDEAIKYCENLTFAGFEDWRLPTLNELLSITDDSGYNPAINKAFKNVAYKMSDKGEKSYGWYWSSTEHAVVSSDAWVLNFGNGNDGWDVVSGRDFVRCVRDY
ncbi:DUF1566 domain-containing protein [Campylobacter concisus]|uniref:Lcl C-terminal domain-containing protein n=1 Tax=Campylobacter concisus TaxID=199 RepID=UPI000CD8AFCC|nr:DUF1566 domain-containing protein [Campylobacter concisus]